MTFNLYTLCGLTASFIIILAIGYASLIYRGHRNERYSILNHFISELGEVGVSKGAWAFNLGLILCGLLFLPYIIWLGSIFQSLLGWLGVAAGVIAGLGVAAVGFFPMNNLKSHGYAAMTFFRGGMAMVILFGLAILFQPPERILVPKLSILLSILAVAAYGSFLALLTNHKKHEQDWENLDPDSVAERPTFWWVPFLEWMVFFTTIFWLSGMLFLV